MDPAPEPPTERPTALRGPARPLPPGFPRLAAYLVTYPANRASLELTLADFRRSDWGAEPDVVTQPADWATGVDSAVRNYRHALERAAAGGADFALILEDDVRVCRGLRRNLLSTPLVARDQCDYFSLFVPDLIEAPWERRERHLGYRLARPLYAGPNAAWEKFRVWGSQAYLLSRRLVLALLARWDGLAEGQDARVLSVCNELRLPLWYSDPCLAEHAPLASAFGTPDAHAPDFDADCVIGAGPGFQPPEAISGRLTRGEGELLYRAAMGRRVLELGTHSGRATVCLAQSAASVLSVGEHDPAEAAEWVARYGRAGRVEFRRGDPGLACAAAEPGFGLALVGVAPDEASIARAVACALPRLGPGGLLAFPDYPDPARPGVRRAVDAHARGLGWRRVAQEGYLGLFRV